MADHSIELVREAELKAEETLRAATQQAAQIVDEAYEKAVQQENAAEDEANNTALEQVAAAHKNSQKTLEQAMTDLNGEMEALADKARQNQVQAVMSILRAMA